MNNTSLKERVAVISGGASGIGRQIVNIFAAHGSNIAILDIDEKSGTETAQFIEREYKIKSLFISCNVADYENVNQACNKIISHFNNVDNIVCAAGYSSRAAIEEMDLSEWVKAVDINLNGTFYVIRCLVNNMLEHKKGNIILIGSATVETGSGGGVHYAATKSAQYGIMRGLSYELLSKGIRTNIITPHIIDTPMLRKRYPDNPEINARLSKRVPIGRIGTPEDIANIALFLASDESSYICGENIIADGGAIHYLH